MQLILWRHAQAEDGKRDFERALTAKGHRQAAKIAAWLRKHLPDKFQVLTSPAVRTRQTAMALGVDVMVVERLAPGANVKDLLEAARWPDQAGAVIIVGHQPTLGEVAAHIVSGSAAGWSVRKGGLWWLEHRLRGGRGEVLVRAVLAPDLI